MKTLAARSSRMKWLHTDFNIAEAGDVERKWYINNLHPPIIHEQLYLVITFILQRFVLMFQRVLSDVLSPERP